MPEPCPYCGDCPPDGECGCIASEDVAALRAQVEDLKAAGRTARDDATSALDLLSRVRFALGDNGTRMQAELLEYCRELAALPGRVAELEAQTPSALKAKLESAEARIAELERLVPDLSLLADEMDESGKKILRWVEGHAIPPGLNLHAHALRLSSLAAFLRR